MHTQNLENIFATSDKWKVNKNNVERTSKSSKKIALEKWARDINNK